MEKADVIMFLIHELSFEDKCRVVSYAVDEVYPTPAPGFTVDIVYECKEKFANWLRQQIGK